MKKTIDQSIVREANLSLVLRNIHNESPLSRAQLAMMTGLNKSTVSSLVEDLMARSLVHEVGMNSIGTGRPATLLEINAQAGAIIGVELGVDFVAVALMNFAGKTIWREKEKADPSEAQDKTIQETLRLVDCALKEAKKAGLRPLGAGLAVPGSVDLREGVLVYSPNLGWRDVPLKKIFAEHTGLKVFVENDANAAAVAEHLFGVMQHTQNFVFVYAGVGIGGGLFINGRLYRGESGYAGEIGHISILTEMTSGESCLCGNPNCWETNSNQRALIRHIELELRSARPSVIPDLMAEQGETSLSVETITRAADAGDALAREVLGMLGGAMGQGVAGLVNIFNPERIVVGGTLSMAADHLLPALREVVSQRALKDLAKGTDISASVFGDDASLFGAVAIVAEDIMWNPLSVKRR